MKINELIAIMLAGGILGLFGQVIRMFVGLTKSYTRDEEISLARLFGSLCIGFTSGGIAIFSVTKWQPDPSVGAEEMLLLMSVGYAGTDFLEGIFRSIMGKYGTPSGDQINMDAVLKQLADSERRIHANVQNQVGAVQANLNATMAPIQGVLRYGPNADPSVVSPYAENVLREMLRRSGNLNALITSTKRSPERQAIAMFNNIRSKGVESQRRLYGANGDLVIDVYEAETRAGASDAMIKKAMEAKIVSIGPQKFSAHMGDFSKLVVVDIAPGSVENHSAFREVVEFEKRNGRVSRAITNLIDDPAFLIEIPNINSDFESSFAGVAMETCDYC